MFVHSGGFFAQKSNCKIHLKGKIQLVEEDSESSISVSLISLEDELVLDQEGLFSFENLCAKEYVLIIKKSGEIWQEEKIKLKGDTYVVYTVDLDSKKLPGFSISGSKSDLSSSVDFRLNQEEIDKSKGLSLGTMLETVNGVRVLKTGTSIAKPIIHGLHSNRVLILNNYIRQEGQQWGAEHAPEIDPFVTNSISIIKGANSIKYGFDAIGGVVLIKAHKISDSAHLSGELNLVGFTNGSQGNISGLLSHRFKNKPVLSIAVQGSMKRGGNYHTPTYYLKNTGVKEYNFSSSVNWEMKKYGIQYYYSQFNTQLGIFSGSHIGNLTDLQNAFEQSVPAEYSGFSYIIDRPKQQIEHELSKAKFYLKTGKIGEINLTYGRQYNLRFEYDKHKSLNDSIANLNQPDLQLELTTHTADLSWKHYLKNGFRGELGLNSIYQKNTYSGRMFIPNYSNQGFGGYIVESKTIDKLVVEAGARFDIRLMQAYFWEDDEIVSPKNNFSDWAVNLGTKYVFKKNNFIAINFSKTWRPPSVNELYSDGLHHGAAAIERGDINLSKENSYNINFDLNIDHKKVGFNINPYFNYFSNYIFLEPQLPPTLTIKGAFPTFKFTEARANIYGLDLLFSYELLENVKFVFKSSVVRGNNLSISDYLIQMPADHFQNKIELEIRDIGFLTKNEFSTAYSFTNRQSRIPANSDYVAPPEAYHLINCMYTTTIETKKMPMTLSLGVNNLFNVSYRDYLNRFRYYADEMGRNFSVRLKLPINK